MDRSRFGERFRIVSLIGRGATADVYRVVDSEREGRELALKHLSRTAAGDPSFAAEFRLLTALNHPNLVRVYEFGRASDRRPWFTMDLVKGRPITEAARSLPLPGTLLLFIQALRALSHIHARGFVHFDIKPANLLVEERPGRPSSVKLLDLGLAGRVGVGRITHAKGSIGYIAPELIRADEADERADLYSLGAVLYESTVGHPPFDGGDAAATLRAHLEVAPAFPAGSGKIPAALRDLILRMLSKDPRERPSSSLRTLTEIARIEGLELELKLDPAARLSEPVYTWRDEPRAEIADRMGAVATGRAAGPILITGPLGVGKSRLLQELRAEATLLGLRVFRADARPGDPAPHGLFLKAFQGTHQPIDAPMRGELDGEFARIADHERYGSLSSRQLHERISRFIRRLAKQGPIAIFLDDLDRADEETLGLIAHAIRFSLRRDAPALFVLAQQGNGEQSALSELDEETETLQVTPRPFDRNEVRSYVAEMVSIDTDSIPRHFVDGLTAATDGLPLFVRESVRAAAKLPGPWPRSLFDRDPSQLPTSLEAIVLKQIRAVPPKLRRLLKFLSVLDLPLDADAIAEASGWAYVAEDLVELAALGLVEKRRDGLAIRSGATRSTLYRKLLPARRRDYHTRIARLLAPKLDSNDPVSDLAHHAARGDDRELAVRAGFRAAEQAIEAHAPGRALKRIEEVLLRRLDKGGREHRHALTLMAKARIARNEYELARRLLVELSQKAVAAKDHSAESEAQRSLSEIARWQGRTDEAREHVSRAEASAALVELVGLRARATCESAEVERAAGRPSHALPKLAEAADLFRRARDWKGLARTWLIRGDLAFGELDAAGAADHHQRALDLEEQIPFALRASAWNRLGMCRAELSDEDGSVDAFRRAHRIFQRIGDREGEASVLNNWGLLERLRGGVSRAIGLLHRALEAYEACGDPLPITSVLRNIATYRIEQSDYSTALDLLNRARTTVGSEPWSAISLRAEAELRSMRLDEAERAFEGAIQVAGDDECRSAHGRAGIVLIRAISKQLAADEAAREATALLTTLPDEIDERLEASILARMLEVHEIAGNTRAMKEVTERLDRINDGEVTMNRVVTMRWRSWLSLEEGDLVGAERRIRRTITLANKLGFREEEREARRVLARAFLVSGRPGKAAAVLYSAMETLQEDWAALPSTRRKAFLMAPRRRALRRELKTALANLRQEIRQTK